MLNKNEFKTLDSKLSDIEKNESEVMATLVGKPLFLVGDLIFKNVFCHTLGFEWFIHITNKLNLPTKEISLPTLSYRVGPASSYARGYQKNLYRGQNNFFTSSFVPNQNIYNINPINFLAVFLNYIARNLGKAVGWAAVFPFVFPAYLIIKAVFSLKKTMLKVKVDQLLKKVDPILIAEQFYNDICLVNKIAAYVDTECFSVFLVDKESTKLEEKIANGSANKQPENFFYFKYYKSARENYLNDKKRWSLFRTFLSGFLIFPLIVTIPSHLKLVQRIENEKKLLTINSAIFEKLTKKIMGYIKGDVRGNAKIDATLFYENGKKFLEEGSLDLAFSYLSKTPESSDQYKQAMYECGNILMNIDLTNNNQYRLAAEYFKKAKTQREAEIASALHRNSKASVLEIYAQHSEPSEILQNASTDAAGSDDKQLTNYKRFFQHLHFFKKRPGFAVVGIVIPFLLIGGIISAFIILNILTAGIPSIIAMLAGAALGASGIIPAILTWGSTLATSLLSGAFASFLGKETLTLFRKNKRSNASVKMNNNLVGNKTTCYANVTNQCTNNIGNTKLNKQIKGQGLQSKSIKDHSEIGNNTIRFFKNSDSLPGTNLASESIKEVTTMTSTYKDDNFNFNIPGFRQFS